MLLLFSDWALTSISWGSVSRARNACWYKNTVFLTMPFPSFLPRKPNIHLRTRPFSTSIVTHRLKMQVVQTQGEFDDLACLLILSFLLAPTSRRVLLDALTGIPSRRVATRSFMSVASRPTDIDIWRILIPRWFLLGYRTVIP